MFGPYCPIYGVGAVLVFGATYTVKDNIILTFLVALLLCSVLEYLTSFLLEKMFRIKWWDYSKTEKFNLNGRICLKVSLAFGFFGVLTVQFVQPFLENFFTTIPYEIKLVASIIFIIVFSFDFVVSLLATLKAKKIVDFSKIVGDQTVAVKKATKDIVKKTIKRNKKY